MSSNNKRMEGTRPKLERPYATLCIEVVIQACRDYKNALMAKRRGRPSRGKSRKGRDKYFQYINVDDVIEECEYFFKNDLSLWCDLDGLWLMDQIRKNVKGR